MADSNHGSRADFLEDDPFAELTRIMGHDPRAAATTTSPVAAVPAAAPEEDDFDIDLEKELMGELDFAEFDEPDAEAPTGWRDQSGQDDSVADLPEWDEPPAPAPVHAEAPASFQPDAGWDDDFGDALERELLPTLDDEAAHDWQAAPEFEPYEPEPVESLPPETAAASYDERADENYFADDLPADEVAPEPVSDAGFSFAARPAADDGHATADSFEDAGMQYTYDEPESLYSDLPDQQPAEPVWMAPEAAASQQPATLSLEDELTALLSDSGPAPRAYEPPVTQAPAREEWRPAVDTFGQTGLSQPEEEETDLSHSPEPFAQPAYEAYQPAFEPAQPAAHADDSFDNLFGDGFDFDIEMEPQPEVSQPVMMAASAGVAAASASATWQSRAAAETDAPEVETIDVAESATAIVDDLDIPDIDYGTPAPAARLHDDLDGEFAHTFDDVATAEAPAEPVAPSAQAASGAHAFAEEEKKWLSEPSYSDQDFDYETDLEEAIAMSGYEDEQPRPTPQRRGLLVAAIVGGVAAIGAVGVFGMSFFGGGSDGPALVRAETDPIKVRPENPGGVTVPNQDSQVYQRVSGGASDAAPGQERLITTAEEPVDVIARTEPLAPGINDEGTDDVFTSDPDGENDDLAAVMGQPKAEDRIVPDGQDATGALPEEVAAVAPRRVRTMIVRPDGTLVPREDPAPSASSPAAVPEAQPSAQVPNVLKAPALPVGTTLDTAAQQPAVEDEGGPVVVTPQTVSVVPTRRAEPQQVAQAPVAQQPQTPAATPVSAPAAAAPVAAGEAAGGWSMQIASQPSAEGAQAAYQDLARRYSSVLEGRGVNIVRANIDGMGTYYRVRIPASSRDEAIQLCTRYKSAGGSCFVSR